jgi:hypothetical protein
MSHSHKQTLILYCLKVTSVSCQFVHFPATDNNTLCEFSVWRGRSTSLALALSRLVMMASGACVSTPGFFEKTSLYVFTTKNKLVRQQTCQKIL